MRLAGVEISDSAAAELARLLRSSGNEVLADHIGHALDHFHDHVALTACDREAVRRALTECPEGLADLRANLLADHLGPQPQQLGV